LEAEFSSQRTGFAERLLDWFDRHGRHDLPWQHPRTPYRVWVSEIMLQQTQVATVIDYFERFMRAFPSVEHLAAASVDDVLALWSGLGYYARGRNLHRAARLIRDQGMPTDQAGWEALPGVGPSTAAAIVSQAFGHPATILDGNVKRVMARHAGIDQPIDKQATHRQLYAIASAHTPERRAADYTQAIMDLGATVCRRSSPSCPECPVRADCIAHGTGRAAELPRRSARKIVPVREREFLAVRDAADRLLLVRRPPTGIWGGLWCLPELDPGEGGEAAERERLLESLGLRVREGRGEVVQRFSHRFTHFQLEARIRSLSLVDGSGVAEGSAHWLPADDRPAMIRRLGLPGPIARILRDGLV